MQQFAELSMCSDGLKPSWNNRSVLELAAPALLVFTVVGGKRVDSRHWFQLGH